MLLEESINHNIWDILQRIKRYRTLNNSNSPIQYEIYLFPTSNNRLSSQEECEILKYLSESGAILVFKRQLRRDFRIIVNLEEIQPKFNDIYREFELSQQRPSIYNNGKNQGARNVIADNQSNYNLLFPKYYLNQEIKRFEMILRHFLKTDAISYKDYRYLQIILNMTSRLISESVGIDKRNKFKRKEYYRNNVKNNQNNGIRNKDFKKQETTINDKETENSSNGKKPLPITGEIVVSGLDEGLKALRAKSSEDKGPKFPYKIPAGTHWNNVIIKFLDNENVEIHVKRLKHKTDFKEMGMIGKGKVPEPSEQWLFMKVLAQCQGEITIRDPEAKDKYKKQKQALTEILRNYFSIDYDPFYPYHSCPEKGGNSYKIKLLLIPPFEKDIRPIITDEDADPLGIKEYLTDTFGR